MLPAGVKYFVLFGMITPQRIILLESSFARTLILAQMVYFNEYTSDLNLAFAFHHLATLPIPDRIF